MNIETLKSETLKLNKSELLDFVQFIIESLKKYETDNFETPEWLKQEILERVSGADAGEVDLISHDEIIGKIKNTYGWDQPAISS